MAAPTQSDVVAIEPTLISIPCSWFLMGSDSGQDCERPIHRVWIDSFFLAATQVTNAEYDRYLRATGAVPPPFWNNPNFNHPSTTGRWAFVARSATLLPMAERTDWPTLSPAHGGRMGTRGPRRPRAKAISLGRRASAVAPRLRKALADRPRTSRALRAECIRPLRHRRQRPRMVQRLVRPELLCGLTRAKSARPRAMPNEASAQILPRRLLAPPNQSRPLLGAFEHSARVSVCGLWVPRRCNI